MTCKCRVQLYIFIILFYYTFIGRAILSSHFDVWHKWMKPGCTYGCTLCWNHTVVVLMPRFLRYDAKHANMVIYVHYSYLCIQKLTHTMHRYLCYHCIGLLVCSLSEWLPIITGSPLLKKTRLSDFQTPILGVGNCSCPVPSIAENLLVTKFRLCRISLVSPLWLTSSQRWLVEKICRVRMKGRASTASQEKNYAR
jgi:hypothetical protein